jgi:hypothetical protein
VQLPPSEVLLQTYGAALSGAVGDVARHLVGSKMCTYKNVFMHGDCFEYAFQLRNCDAVVELV